MAEIRIIGPGEAGLMDRLWLLVFPQILGETGREPIFAGLPDIGLELVGTDVLDGRLVAAGTYYRDELLEVLRDEVSHLREQLDRERDSSAELRRIVAGLIQRVPELEAAPEQRDVRETASQGPSKVSDVHPEPQELSERRSWLSRFFFGP